MPAGQQNTEAPNPLIPNPMAQKIKFEKSVPKPLLNLIHKLQRNYPFFTDMEDMEVGQFLKLCKRENYEPGKGIFREGDNGNEFFLVVSGEVIITVGEKEVARMGPGTVFGEMALLDNTRRTASAMVASPTLLFSISRGVLHSSMPSFANKVMEGIARQLSEKLRDANETIKKLQRQVNQLEVKKSKI
ncbi:MAG: cyclic nucleotide-binding domain-containing protein [Nitrospinaceae bacterium]|jgi:CRP/FNR family transcriptional regulator, cyclic AMP receptor protein|nr:cyclic nucleotide-binding domain-containing protein [Nitrospinaceae bacterium]